MGQRGADRGVGGRLASLLRSALDGVAAVVLASACAACGTPLDRPLDGCVCGVCWRSLSTLVPPLWSSGDIALGRAVGPYDGALRNIVHALKYEGRRSLARPLAFLMRARGADVLSGADAVVPVPLHPSKRRQRGFNQAADLARHLDLPIVHALARVRATASQTALQASQRHRNVRDAFAPARSAPRIAAAVVVLIDDVSTTGATLESCARTLRQAGAREVRALTAARVVTVPR